MQNYCGGPKNEDLFKIGLLWLKDIEENIATQAYAPDPHKVGRTLDAIDRLAVAQMIMHASRARMASSDFLNFDRLDYPALDPPEWHKWITIKLEGNEVKIGDLPIDFWGPLKENYETHNKNYQGWYNKRFSVK
jgi:succinate dehydrogenase/fumarate reductase flavoprotein subunit